MINVYRAWPKNRREAFWDVIAGTRYIAYQGDDLDQEKRFLCFGRTLTGTYRKAKRILGRPSGTELKGRWTDIGERVR